MRKRRIRKFKTQDENELPNLILFSTLHLCHFKAQLFKCIVGYLLYLMSISSSSIFSNYKFLIQPPTPEYKDFSSPSNYWVKIGPSCLLLPGCLHFSVYQPHLRSFHCKENFPVWAIFLGISLPWHHTFLNNMVTRTMQILNLWSNRF